MRVARRIAAARRAQGITQEDFAALIGTAPRSYQRIEAGAQNLTLRTVARIAGALKLSPEELITGVADGAGSLPRAPTKERATRRRPLGDRQRSRPAAS